MQINNIYIIYTYTIGIGNENKFYNFIIKIMAIANLSIPQIHCISCDALIRLSLNNLDGIRSSSVNLSSKIATIEFNDKIITKEKIQQQIQEYTGYKVL